MPLLTVRLTDEEHAALKALAGTRSMASLIKGWIAAGGDVYTLDRVTVDRPVDMPTKPAVIGQIRRLPGGPDYVDMGTLPIAVEVPNPRDGSNIVSTGHAKPSFLAAPDDDCAACGHDRHTYHLDGACRMPIAPKRRCGCPAFVPALDEEVPF